MVARWLLTGLLETTHAHCVWLQKTKVLTVKRLSFTTWSFYGIHIFLFYIVYDVNRDLKPKFSILRVEDLFLKYFVNI